MSWVSGALNLAKNIISKPLEVLSDWCAEPLKSREHNRNESSKKHQHRREMEKLNAEAKFSHEIKIKEMKTKTDLEIKKVTEIEKSIAEIDEWKKEKEFERMKKTTEAIAIYLKELTKLNVDTINAIGNMQLELKERAQQLVYEKTSQYKKLQDDSFKEAINDLSRIEEKFKDNERAKDILINAVDIKLGNIINTSTRFLEELNRDIVNLNLSIDRLTMQGQQFIENHLKRFHISDNSLPINLETKSNKNLTKLDFIIDYDTLKED